MALLDTDEVIFKLKHEDEGYMTVEGTGSTHLPYEWIPKNVELDITLLETPDTPSCNPPTGTKVKYATIGTCVVISYDVPQLTEIKWKITN